MSKHNLINKRFGKLVVIAKAKSRNGRGYWLCKCDCGNEMEVRTDGLTTGNTKSCGCLHKEHMEQLNEKQWKNEDFKKNKSEQTHKRNKEMWQNKEYSELLKSKMKEAWEDEELRNKASKAMKERWLNKEFRDAHTGENNSNYNPNLTDEERKYNRERNRHIDGYKEWVYEVKKQANFTCDCCGEHGCKLCSHHLESFSDNKELRTELTNGVCLCEKCHKEFHRTYGYKNNTKEQYVEFKKAIITREDDIND